jgi:HK97 gp10 family phage protein
MAREATLHGTEEVLHNLQEMTKRVRNKGLKAAILPAAELVRAEASANAPVKTGKLSGNIIAEYDGRRRTAKVGPDKTVFYGDFVERGTSKTGAHPFLRPALESKAEDAYRVMAGELKLVVEAV